jgi:hypothetical protein
VAISTSNFLVFGGKTLLAKGELDLGVHNVTGKTSQKFGRHGAIVLLEANVRSSRVQLAGLG